MLERHLVNAVEWVTTLNCYSKQWRLYSCLKIIDCQSFSKSAEDVICICVLMIILKLILQILWRTQFICLFNNAEFNNESNLLLRSGLLDYPRMQNTILASKCLQYKINNWQRVAGCRVIIGCRRRLKRSSSTADSLVISFWLNENHGLNPSKEIRKMWAHYWCPLTGWCVCICLLLIGSQICWFASATHSDITFRRCQ